MESVLNRQGRVPGLRTLRLKASELNNRDPKAWHRWWNDNAVEGGAGPLANQVERAAQITLGHQSEGLVAQVSVALSSRGREIEADDGHDQKYTDLDVEVFTRFKPDVDPMDEAMDEAVEALLPAKSRPTSARSTLSDRARSRPRVVEYRRCLLVFAISRTST